MYKTINKCMKWKNYNKNRKGELLGVTLVIVWNPSILLKDDTWIQY